MRALVITSVEPLREGLKIWGTYWRLKLFLQALCEIANKIDLLHLVSEQFITENPNEEIVSAQQAAFLGLPLSAHLISCQPRRPLTFASYYLSGISSIYRQQEFYWYAGADQVTKISAFLDQSPDIVFVHRLTAMVPLLRCARRPAHMFFDLDDIVHRVRIQAALRPPLRLGKLGDLCHIPAMAVAEWRGAAISRLTFVCSDVDRSRLRRLGFPRIAVIPNTLPIPPEPVELPTAPTILVLASWNYPPNISAAERLIRRIFPRIRAAVPEAQLLVAGNGSLELAERWGRSDGVHYSGYVDDLRPLYRSARMVCCPLTHGSGTRLKLIEAAGYARPMVTTKFAAEGLNLRDGVEILFREDDNAIASACIQLMHDDALCRALGAAARARILRTHDPVVVQRSIVQLINEQGLASAS